MSVINITADNFENEVIKSDKTVLLDFYADWCGPCQMISPILHEIAEERSDIKVGKINVDNEPRLAGEFGITSIPFLAVIKNSTVAATALGYRSKEEIIALL